MCKQFSYPEKKPVIGRRFLILFDSDGVALVRVWLPGERMLVFEGCSCRDVHGYVKPDSYELIKTGVELILAEPDIALGVGRQVHIFTCVKEWRAPSYNLHADLDELHL